MWSNKKVITLCVSVLIILNILTLFGQRSMRKNFEQQVNNLNSQIGFLSNQLNNQVNSVNQSLNKFNEEQKWVSTSGYKFIGYDQGSGLINTEVNWSFREISQNSTVYLAFGEQGPNSQNVDKWNNVKASAVDNLNYKANILLSPDKNYVFKVQVKGQSSTKGEEIMDIDMIGVIQNRFSLMPMFGSQRGPKYDNHLMVVNNARDGEPLYIKSAKAEVYVDGKLQNTVELHKASPNELSQEEAGKFTEGIKGDIWLNNNAIWINGEDNWVKNGDNSWTYKGSNPPSFDNIRIDVTIIDNMGLTYKKTYGH